LPAVLGAARGAELQAGLPGLRLLHVLFGFLLNRILSEEAISGKILNFFEEARTWL